MSFDQRRCGVPAGDNGMPACGTTASNKCCADGECCETDNASCANKCGSGHQGGSSYHGRLLLRQLLGTGDCSGGSGDSCVCSTELCGGNVSTPLNSNPNPNPYPDP